MMTEPNYHHHQQDQQHLEDQEESEEIPLPELLSHPSRPVFLLGEVPPREGTPHGKCQTIANKFFERSKALACDGFIVYDIQDEFHTTVDGEKRPFPFRKVMDSSPYAALLSRTSGKQCLVYKCVTVVKFDKWIDQAKLEHGHNAINLIGRAPTKPPVQEQQQQLPSSLPFPSSSSSTSTSLYPYDQGPTLFKAMETTKQKNMPFGCVCIPQRHTLEAAKKRGKAYPTEHLNMVKKQTAGAKWFISQAIYDAAPTIRLLKDYAALCKIKGIRPAKIILTFCPVSRPKTIQFIKWLGVHVPREDVEEKILQSTRPVETSVQICCDVLTQILQETIGIGVPLGISCESVSIYKAEIDGVHDLFRKLQGILLDSRGTPWKVQWVDVRMPKPQPTNPEEALALWLREEEEKKERERRRPRRSIATTSGSTSDTTLIAGGFLMGVALGGSLVAMGVALGGGGGGGSRHAK